jgi:RHS repeat-associated protein
MTSTTASTQWIQETYMDPFGGLLHMVDENGQGVSSASDHLFTDQERDGETGLDYFGARFYDSWIGRFLSQDPELISAHEGVTFGRIGDDPTNLNPYAYVLNRPTSLVDPTGAFPSEGPWLPEINRLADVMFLVVPGIGADAGMPGRISHDREDEPVQVAAYEGEEGCTRLSGACVSDAVVPFMVGLGPLHHIATNKNMISLARGGPWTPRFEKLFRGAGMRLNDALNKAPLPGHRGPHPEAYHKAVYDRLVQSVQGLKSNTNAYREALQGELRALQRDVTTPGTHLHRLLTGQ